LNKQLCQNEGETRKTRKQETLSLVVSQQNPEEANNAANDPDESELGNYLDSLTAPKKRLSEEHWLRELRKSHPASEVALALRHLREHGALGSGETCHSPLRYLATAMKDVLAAAHPLAEQRKRAQDDSEAIIRREREQAEREARDEAEWREAEGAFVAAFPNESVQAAQVEAFVGEQLHGIRPPGGVARRLAVRHWWRANGERVEHAN